MENSLDSILKAFADYIRGQNYFDIVHSEKIGYIKILVKEPCCPERLDTPEKMMDVLFNEIINDVVFSPENPKGVIVWRYSLQATPTETSPASKKKSSMNKQS